MADDKIEIEIVLDEGSVKKGFINLQKASEEIGKNFSSNFDTSFKNIGIGFAKITTAAIAAGVAVGGVIAKKAIDSAAEFETNVNKLNIALANTGLYTKQAGEDFLSFASAIQNTTKFSDDQVVSSAALIQNIARLSSTEALKGATQAALDLSSALGIDLESAASLVGKAANGNVEALKRYGIEIQKGKTDTESFANTLRTLEQRFGGVASASANSFQGATTQLRNAFDDILKEIGKAIIKSPAIVTLIKSFTDIFTKIAESISTAIGGRDIFKGFIINLAVITQASIETANRIALSFELAFERIIQAWKAAKVLFTGGLFENTNSELAKINDEIDKTKSAFSEDTKVTKYFDDLILKLSETSGKFLEFNNLFKGGADAPGIKDSLLEITNIATVFGIQFGKVIESASEQAKRFQQVGIQAGQMINQALTAVAVRGIQTLTNALIRGKASFSDFGKFIFQTLGDLATQMGTLFISAGIGMLALGKLSPQSAIIAGAALVAVGQIFKAMGGGESAAASSGGGASSSISGGAAGGFGTAVEAPEQIQEKTTQVKIDVAGTVLSPLDVGRQIAQILNDTFDATGTKVVTA